MKNLYDYNVTFKNIYTENITLRDPHFRNNHKILINGRMNILNTECILNKNKVLRVLLEYKLNKFF